MNKNTNGQTIGVGDAQRHFSDLLDRVRQDSLIVTITRHGKAVARLVPVNRVPTSAHLAEARGWLEDDDPLFCEIDRVVVDRTSIGPAKLLNT